MAIIIFYYYLLFSMLFVYSMDSCLIQNKMKNEIILTIDFSRQLNRFSKESFADEGICDQNQNQNVNV